MRFFKIKEQPRSEEDEAAAVRLINVIGRSKAGRPSDSAMAPTAFETAVLPQ